MSIGMLRNLLRKGGKGPINVPGVGKRARSTVQGYVSNPAKYSAAKKAAKGGASATRTFKVRGQNRKFSRAPGSPMTAKDKAEINAAFKKAEKGRRKKAAKAAKKGGAEAVKKRAAAEARSQRQVLRKEVSRLKSLSAKRNKAKTAKARTKLDSQLKTLSTRMKKREDRINALLATAGQR